MNRENKNSFPDFSWLNSDGDDDFPETYDGSPEAPMPGDEPAEAGDFCGTEQNAAKLVLCRHIRDMAAGINRISPAKIRIRSSSTDDPTQRSWVLFLELPSPAVCLSLSVRKRLCEMMLAADRVVITAVPEENCTRFTCIVTDLWKE